MTTIVTNDEKRKLTKKSKKNKVINENQADLASSDREDVKIAILEKEKEENKRDIKIERKKTNSDSEDSIVFEHLDRIVIKKSNNIKSEQEIEKEKEIKIIEVDKKKTQKE